MRFDIPWEDNYIGSWIGDPSAILVVRKVGRGRYAASLTINGKPFLRPWLNGEPTIDMPARYRIDALGGSDFCIDLWPPKTRISMHLVYEPHYDLDPKHREALTYALGCDDDATQDSEEYFRWIQTIRYFVRGEII